MKKVLASVLAVSAAVSLFAADLNYYVVPPGTPGVPENPDYLSWETAGTNIYEAVYLAGEQHVGKTQKDYQHTLFVKSGFYLVTNKLFVGDCKTTIRSSKGPGATWEIDREGTILCGGYPATTNCIFWSEGNSVSRAVQFRGFTVTNGYSTGRGGGIRFFRSARSDTGIFDCTVVDCHAMMGPGGGIDFSPDNCTAGIISNCFVHSCTASNRFESGYNRSYVGGGGIVFGQNGSASYGTSSRTSGLRIFDTIASNNVIYGNAIMTSGIWIKQIGAWVENCTVISNRAYAMNGGNQASCAALGGNSRCTYVNCKAIGNYCVNSQGAGPGLVAAIGSVVSNCVFKDNWGSGHIVTLGTSIATLSGVTYTNPVKFVNCVIDGNRGSGITALWPGYQSIIRNNFITHCTGYSGQVAPLYLSDGSVRCENNTIVGNSKGVLCMGTGNGRMVNCVLDNDQNVHQAQLVAGYTGIIFSNCWISARSTTTQPKYNCLTMSTANAKFVDPANGDYRLQRKSPLIDAGLKQAWMAEAVDLDGNPRLHKGKASSSEPLPDIGCYESTNSVPGMVIVVR